MIRGVLGAPALALALWAAGAAAQVPDVPSGSATLRGQVIHAETKAPIPGAEVVLYALPAAAPPGMRRLEAREDGSFSIEGIDGSPGTTYLVGARYLGVSHPGSRVVFAPGETERTVLVEVSEVSTVTGDAAARTLRVRIDWLGDQLVVTETLALENPGRKTVARPEAGAPIVELGLPVGAGPLTGALGVVPQGLVRRADAIAWFGPLFPGTHEVEYAYPLTAGGTGADGSVGAGSVDLARTLPEGLELTVLVAAGGPKLDAPGLAEGDTVALRGRSYASFAGRTEGGPVALTLTLPAARREPGAVSLAEVRWIGDLDDAALSVREEHVLLVEGPSPVVAGDAPLHSIPIPAGASEFRFGARESGSALVPVEGALGVLGPLAPGETVIEVSYRLAGGHPLRLERRFGIDTPLVSLYLTDNGNLDVSSERLHRRRPVRTSDRTYIHFEAFALEADERIDLLVEALPPRRRLPQRASLVGIALGAAAAIALLVSPLRERPQPPAPDRETESGSRREREALYAALRDLEHDFETGKISGEDHDRMRRELRGRALTSLAEDREGPAEDPPPAPPTRCSCGRAVAPDDRFCSSCGAQIGSEP